MTRIYQDTDDHKEDDKFCGRCGAELVEVTLPGVCYDRKTGEKIEHYTKKCMTMINQPRFWFFQNIFREDVRCQKTYYGWGDI